MHVPHRYHARVNYSDADILGIMHHARYLECAERARLETLVGWQVNMDPATNAIRYAIARLTLRFAQGIKLHQPFIIDSYARDARSMGISFTQLFFTFNESPEQPDAPIDPPKTLAVRLDIDLLTIGPHLKPQRLPQDMAALFQQAAQLGQQALQSQNIPLPDGSR